MIYINSACRRVLKALEVDCLRRERKCHRPTKQNKTYIPATCGIGKAVESVLTYYFESCLYKTRIIVVDKPSHRMQQQQQPSPNKPSVVAASPLHWATVGRAAVLTAMTYHQGQRRTPNLNPIQISVL